jgi:hypothetical protein
MTSYNMPGRIETVARSTTKAIVWRTLTVGKKEVLAISAPVLFYLIMLVAEYLQAGYNPISDTISSLVWGTYRWLQTVNFFVFGGLLIAFVIGLRLNIKDKFKPIAGRVTLFLIGVGFVILAVCPSQSPEGIKTAQAFIHNIAVGSMAFLFPVACFLLEPGFRSDSRSGFMASYTIAAGIIGLCLIVIGVFLLVAEISCFGLIERLLLSNALLWLEVFGFHSMRTRKNTIKNANNIIKNM